MSPRVPAPDFIIIGMPKTATTSLHETLAEHPDVFALPYKEPNFFADDLTAEAETTGARQSPPPDSSEYRALFSGASSHQLRMESSTNYIFSNVAPHRIAKERPHCKALLILREPTSWVQSWYQQKHGYHLEHLPIKDAYLASRDGTDRELPPEFARPSSYNYYYLALPVEGIRRWKQALGDDLMITTFSHVTKEWETFRRELFRFLDIQDLPLDLKRSNPTTRARFRFISRSLERWKPYQYRHWLGRGFKPLSALYRKIFFPRTNKPDWRPPKDDFKKRVKEAENITGLPLSQLWGY